MLLVFGSSRVGRTMSRWSTGRLWSELVYS
jgi:hypothetical protein